jgi:hypothetical protein
MIVKAIMSFFDELKKNKSITFGALSGSPTMARIARDAADYEAEMLRRELRAKELGKVYNVDWEIFLDPVQARAGMAGTWKPEGK